MSAEEFKKEIAETEWFKEYMEHVAMEREKFMKRMLRSKLKWYDKPLFFFYRKLADYFGGGQRVIALQKRTGYQDAMFGIKIYGKEYWMTEKPIQEIQSNGNKQRIRNEGDSLSSDGQRSPAKDHHSDQDHL